MLSVEGFPDSSQFLCMLGLSLLIPLVRGPGCRLWIQFQETREDEIFNNSIFFSLLNVCLLFLNTTY